MCDSIANGPPQYNTNTRTLTIPFISATTLNVASTSNLVGAITSSQIALVGFTNIVTRRPILSAMTSFSINSTAITIGNNTLVNPFGDVAALTGATRKYRLYAVWGDSLSGTAALTVSFNTNTTTHASFAFSSYSSTNAINNMISGFSDTQVLSSSPATATIQASATGSAVGSSRSFNFYYIEIQALDQY